MPTVAVSCSTFTTGYAYACVDPGDNPCCNTTAAWAHDSGASFGEYGPWDAIAEDVHGHGPTALSHKSVAVCSSGTASANPGVALLAGPRVSAAAHPTPEPSMRTTIGM